MMNGLKSSTKDSQVAPNCFLYPVMPKTFSSSSKVNLHPLQDSTPTQTTSPALAHTKGKLSIWICPGTTSIPVYRPKLTFQMAMLASNDRCPTITEPSFRKLNSPTTKLGRRFTHISKQVFSVRIHGALLCI